MKFWAGLYSEMDKEVLKEEVNTMLKLVMDILASKKSYLGLYSEMDNHSVSLLCESIVGCFFLLLKSPLELEVKRSLLVG